MRAGVPAAAERLVYPLKNRLALRSPPTRVIGLVLADVGNPFYGEVAGGAIDAARMLGYEVFLAHTQESGDLLNSIVNAMIARRVDGFLLTVLHPDDGEVVRRLRGAGVAFVQSVAPDLGPIADFVGVDDCALGGGRGHYASRGRRRPAHGCRGDHRSP